MQQSFAFLLFIYIDQHYAVFLNGVSHYSKKSVLSILLTVEVRRCFTSPTMKQKWKRRCKAEIFLQNTQKSEHEINTKVAFHNFLEVFMLHHLFSAVWFG